MSDNLTPEPKEPSLTGRPRTPADEPGWERAALERIALAAITEQRAARRWKIFFRFVFLIVLLLAVWGDEHLKLRQKAAYSLFVPITYVVFYVLSFVQIFVVLRAVIPGRKQPIA